MHELHVALHEVIPKNSFHGGMWEKMGWRCPNLYIHDVMFLGELSHENARSLVQIIRCFYLTSGLKINFRKIKLMGIAVAQPQVEDIDSIVGCSPIKLPIIYLSIVSKKHKEIVKNFITKLSFLVARGFIICLYLGSQLTII